jgi:hypothetical protein
MQLTQTSTAVQFEDLSWLGNDKALNPQSCTLRTAAFTANTHYPKGFIPSGIELGLYIGGSFDGLFGPFDKGASDGRQTLAGYLHTSQTVRDTSADILASILEGGQPVIIVARLPLGTLLTATEQRASTRFTYHAA